MARRPLPLRCSRPVAPRSRSQTHSHEAPARNRRDTRARQTTTRPETTCPHGIATLSSTQLFGESDKEPFRPADVAKPIRVIILDDFADELGAARTQPFQC